VGHFSWLTCIDICRRKPWPPTGAFHPPSMHLYTFSA
jgi:hypothetical protein